MEHYKRMNSVNVTSNTIEALFIAKWTWSPRTIIVLTISGLIAIFTVLG